MLLLLVSKNQDRRFLCFDIYVNTLVDVIQHFSISDSSKESWVHIRRVTNEDTVIIRNAVKYLYRSNRSDRVRFLVEVDSFQCTVKCHIAKTRSIKEYCSAISKQAIF
nr:MAG TPA: hypothetical protein [Caudoviricetes sp.]